MPPRLQGRARAGTRPEAEGETCYSVEYETARVQNNAERLSYKTATAALSAPTVGGPDAERR